MRLVYRLYPIILWTFCLLIFFLGGLSLQLIFDQKWLLLLSPLPTAFLASVFTNIIATRFPKLWYVNDAEIDGLGYVHQPLDVLIPPLLVAFVTCGLLVWGGS